MSTSLNELIIIIVILVLLVCLAIIIVLVPLLLFRRIRALEGRIEKLEAKQDATSSHSGEKL